MKSLRAATALVAELAPAVKSGWRICLVCYKPPEDAVWLRPFHEIGIEIVYLPRARRNFDAACVRRAYRLCRDLDASVLHCDNIHTSPLIGAALARVPVRIWSKRAMEPWYEACREPTLRDRFAPSLHLSGALATTLIAVSAAVKNQMLELGLPASKVTVLHNPVEWKSPDPTLRDAERTRLGYKPSHLVVVTLGYGMPVKGWDTLARAFAGINTYQPNARLLFVGSENLPAGRAFMIALRRYLHDSGLQAKAQFQGYLTDIDRALAAADIFVLPSRSEGFARALLEGLAAGLPCISTRVGIAAEVIQDGVNGYVIEREDHVAMGKRLLMLARDPVARRRIGEAARTRPPLPAPEEHGEQLLAIYESLIRTRRHSPA